MNEDTKLVRTALGDDMLEKVMSMSPREKLAFLAAQSRTLAQRDFYAAAVQAMDSLAVPGIPQGISEDEKFDEALARVVNAKPSKMRTAFRRIRPVLAHPRTLGTLRALTVITGIAMSAWAALYAFANSMVIHGFLVVFIGAAFCCACSDIRDASEWKWNPKRPAYPLAYGPWLAGVLLVAAFTFYGWHLSLQGGYVIADYSASTEAPRITYTSDRWFVPVASWSSRYQYYEYVTGDCEGDRHTTPKLNGITGKIHYAIGFKANRQAFEESLRRGPILHRNASNILADARYLIAQGGYDSLEDLGRQLRELGSPEFTLQIYQLYLEPAHIGWK